MADHRFQPAATALSRIRRGESLDAAASWVFSQCMSEAERDAFDQALVDTDHPSAYQAGTQQHRFYSYVSDLVESLGY